MDKRHNKTQQTENNTIKAMRSHFRIYSIILVIAMVLCFLAINVAATLAESRLGLKADLTEYHIYSLSEESENILKELDQDIEIYTLYPTGKDDTEISLLLEKYAAASDHITVSNVDPETNPTFTTQFDPNEEGISSYSVIVTDAAHEKYKVYSLTDLKIFVTASDGSYVKIGSKAEQKITSAIHYIETGTVSRAVFLTGHDEINANSLAQMLLLLDGMNFELTQYNYLEQKFTLDPATDTLFVISPQSDLSDEEYEEIKAFLDAGGRAVFFMDNIFVNEDSATAKTMIQRLPNFDLLLKAYDMEVNKDYVIAASSDGMYQKATKLVCEPSSHTITDTILAAGRSPIISDTSSIKVNTVASQGTTVTPLVYSNENCYAKTLTNELNSLEQESTDATGRFLLGAIAEKSNGSQVVLFASSSMLTDTEIQRSGNTDLVVNTAAYLNERTDSIVIAQKQTVGNVMQFESNGQVYAMIILVVAVMPLLLAAIGLVIWIRRKKR